VLNLGKWKILGVARPIISAKTSQVKSKFLHLGPRQFQKSNFCFELSPELLDNFDIGWETKGKKNTFAERSKKVISTNIAEKFFT